jgi:hypothetical protein
MKFCDGDHIALAQSALVFKARSRAAMRQAVFIAVVASLLIATVVEVIAAGARTVVARNHSYYAAPPSGIGIAVPSGMKGSPTELLPR